MWKDYISLEIKKLRCRNERLKMEIKDKEEILKCQIPESFLHLVPLDTTSPCILDPIDVVVSNNQNNTSFLFSITNKTE
jgi:hypothetical protein